MAIPGIVDKVITYALIAFFFIGIWDATNMLPSETPWYTQMGQQVTHFDFSKIFSLVEMGLSWSVLTPTIHVSQLPFVLGWYGFWFSLFVPSGFIPVPGIEVVMYLAFIFLLVLLPFSIIVKRKFSKKKNTGMLGLPKWFWIASGVIILMAYPLWVWINLQIFVAGASSFFNIAPDAALTIYTSFGQNTQSISIILIIFSILGLVKGVSWSRRFKVF